MKCPDCESKLDYIPDIELYECLNCGTYVARTGNESYDYFKNLMENNKGVGYD